MIANNSRMPDMSPEAIDQRIREVAQLYELGISIQSAKKLGKVKDYKREHPVKSKQAGIGELRS
jgi:hypothetical protein